MYPATRIDRGFTFAEVLLCVYILAVALLGLLAVLVHCLKAQQQSQERQLATRMAEDVLVQATRLPFAEDHRRPLTALGDFQYALDEHELASDLKAIEVAVYFGDQQLRLTELIYHAP